MVGPARDVEFDELEAVEKRRMCPTVAGVSNLGRAKPSFRAAQEKKSRDRRGVDHGTCLEFVAPAALEA